MNLVAATRRPRGSLVAPLRVGFVLEASANDRLAAASMKADITKSELVQWLIVHFLDEESGLPLGYTPRPATDQTLEGLSITEAA